MEDPPNDVDKNRILESDSEASPERHNSFSISKNEGADKVHRKYFGVAKSFSPNSCLPTHSNTDITIRGAYFTKSR